MHSALTIWQPFLDVQVQKSSWGWQILGGGELGVVVPPELELEAVLPLVLLVVLLAVLEAPPAPGSMMLVPPQARAKSRNVAVNGVMRRRREEESGINDIGCASLCHII